MLPSCTTIHPISYSTKIAHHLWQSKWECLNMNFEICNKLPTWLTQKICLVYKSCKNCSCCLLSFLFPGNLVYRICQVFYIAWIYTSHAASNKSKLSTLHSARAFLSVQICVRTGSCTKNLQSPGCSKGLKNFHTWSRGPASDHDT